MLTIAHFQANYAIPHGTPDRGAVPARLDRLARERLPGVVASHLVASPADAEAVYRIRHLEIDLWLDALVRVDGDIAERWGRLLVQALTYTLLYGPPGQVMRYDNHAHFIASFLGEMMEQARPKIAGGGAGEQMFNSLLTDEIAKEIARTGGLGLSQSIAAQLDAYRR